MDKCFEILNKIKTKGPLAIKYTIQSANHALDESTNGFETEYKAFGYLITTEDGREGAKAFIEKRKPNFQGK
jgi:enoyl-CoA hydratase